MVICTKYLITGQYAGKLLATTNYQLKNEFPRKIISRQTNCNYHLHPFFEIDIRN